MKGYNYTNIYIPVLEGEKHELLGGGRENSLHCGLGALEWWITPLVVTHRVHYLLIIA